MPDEKILARIQGMSKKEKRELVDKIARSARDWELAWGG